MIALLKQCTTIPVLSALIKLQEKGAGSIKVNGEEVKLGIPGGEAYQQMAVELSVPLKRVGTPKEAAGAMLLLASPYATFITGQSLEVTGGAFIWYSSQPAWL